MELFKLRQENYFMGYVQRKNQTIMVHSLVMVGYINLKNDTISEVTTPMENQLMLIIPVLSVFSLWSELT